MAPLVLWPPFISITFPAGAEGCFHPSPSRKKSLIQGIENICKSNYLPRALPTRPPPSSSWQLRLSPILLLFSVHKELAWLNLGIAWSGFVRSCSAHHCHDASSLSYHCCMGVPSTRGRVPTSGLGMGGGSHIPWLGGVTSRLLHPTAQPISSRDVPWGMWGTLSQLPPLQDLGSLPCFSPPSFPAGSRTGFTRTLRPGCFPINCYFLIPFAARRAAAQLLPSAGCPPARS